MILLRKMQIEKIAASVALSYHSDVDLISDRLWGDIESELRKILLSIDKLNTLLRGADSFIISSALRVQYPAFVQAMRERQQLINGAHRQPLRK